MRVRVRVRRIESDAACFSRVACRIRIQTWSGSNDGGMDERASRSEDTNFMHADKSDEHVVQALGRSIRYSKRSRRKKA